MSDGSSAATPRLRSATPDDSEFLRDVFLSARWSELDATGWSEAEKSAFLSQQSDFQARHYAREFPGARFDVIEDTNGRRLGRLYVDRSEERHLIIDITLLPAERGRGLGTRLIRELMEEAARFGRPVRLTVEFFNRARHLYERLGFVRVGGDEVFCRMEWPAP